MPPWLIALDTCPSTSTWALERWEALAHGACVWTTRQTAGRGRNGSAWQAPAGVLTASFVLHLAGDAGAISLAAGLAVCHACEDLMPGLRVALKWPNDAVIGERKLAGVLCERPDPGAVVVGIGLNVDPRWNDDPSSLPIATRATSLAEHGSPPAMVDLLTGLRRYLLEGAGLLAAGGLAPLLPGLRQRDVLCGRPCVITTGGGDVRGTGDGLDDLGRLRLVTGDGPLALASGHVSHW